MESINKAEIFRSINSYSKELVSTKPDSQLNQLPEYVNKETAGVQVNISEAGYSKLNKERAENINSAEQSNSKTKESTETDKADLGRKITKQLLENSTEAAGKADENKPKDPIDEMIAQIKKQIEEVSFKLKQLNNDKSETALEQKKELQNQLVELNGQLLALMEKKMSEAKKV
jgi:hypothetical protein